MQAARLPCRVALHGRVYRKGLHTNPYKVVRSLGSRDSVALPGSECPNPNGTLRIDEIGVLTPKPDTSKKVLLSVWWGINGIIYWELLPTNSTITAEIYCVNNWIVLQLDYRRIRSVTERPLLLGVETPNLI